MFNFHTQQIYYQLRCNYESQPHQQQHSPMIWSTISHPEGCRFGSLTESDYFSQSIRSFSEPTVVTHDTCKRHSSCNSSELRVSTLLSPLIVCEDTSQPTNNTSLLSRSISSDSEIPAKQNLLTIKRGRSASYHAPERDSGEKTDERPLSFSDSATFLATLKIKDKVVDNNPSKPKHKKNKALRLTLNRNKCK